MLPQQSCQIFLACFGVWESPPKTLQVVSGGCKRIIGFFCHGIQIIRSETCQEHSGNSALPFWRRGQDTSKKRTDSAKSLATVKNYVIERKMSIVGECSFPQFFCLAFVHNFRLSKLALQLPTTHFFHAFFWQSRSVSRENENFWGVDYWPLGNLAQKGTVWLYCTCTVTGFGGNRENWSDGNGQELAGRRRKAGGFQQYIGLKYFF